MTIKVKSAEQGALVRDCICSNHKYREEIHDEKGKLITNPESKATFARNILIGFIKNNIRKYRINEVETVRTEKIELADTESEGIDVV